MMEKRARVDLESPSSISSKREAIRIEGEHALAEGENASGLMGREKELEERMGRLYHGGHKPNGTT